MVAINIFVIIIFPYYLLALVYRHPNFYIVEGIVYLHIEFLTEFLIPGGTGCLAAKYQVCIINLSGIYSY